MNEYSNPDPDLASELRRGAGNEWNQEAAEDERLTELHRKRSLGLSDQAREMANRGDRVSVEFGGHSFSGAIAVAGSDYVTINGPGQIADIRVDEARWSVLPSQISADPGRTTTESFRALLHGYSDQSGVIRLALPQGDLVIGRISVVAEDHIEMSDVDDRKLIVPLKLILAVVRSADSQ